MADIRLLSFKLHEAFYDAVRRKRGKEMRINIELLLCLYETVFVVPIF